MTTDKITYIDASQFEGEVLQSARPVVVDFYSTECPPCDALASKYEALAELYGDDVKFIKIFRQENRALAEALGVLSSPTVLFYAGGQLTGDRLAGGIKRADLERNLAALLAPERVEVIRRRVHPVTSERDVIIIGGGPAGLTAAIYTAQAKLSTVVVDRALAGGNLAITHQISNFPGFPEPQPGYELAYAMSEHARRAGAELREAVDITRVDLDAKEVEIDGVETIRGRTLIIATGSSPRPLGVPGEAENRGKGISYCATCDAKYYEGKHVVVIGGGNSAIEESLFITRFASRITVVHQFAELQANRQAQEAAFANPKIELLFRHEPREFIRTNGTVGRVVVEQLDTGVLRPLSCDGVFVFAGMQPNLELFGDALARDEWGYLQVDDEMRTSVPGVFAAGDVRSKRYRQMTTAVSDGTVAAIAAAQELELQASVPAAGRAAVNA